MNEDVIDLEQDSFFSKRGCEKKKKKNLFFLRKLKYSDIPTVEKIQEESFPIKYDEEFYSALAEDKNIDSLVAVDRETNQIIGIISSRLESEEFFDYLFRSVHIKKGYIMTLAVRKQFRRLGVGSDMVRSLERLLIRKYDLNSIYLHTECSNGTAITFYKKHGFLCVRKSRNYYFINETHTDAMVLKKEYISEDRNLMDRQLCLTVVLVITIFFLSMILITFFSGVVYIFGGSSTA